MIRTLVFAGTGQNLEIGENVGPLRIIILAILVYIGYRLLVGSSRKKKTGNSSQAQDANTQITDVLVEDPVCRKLVPQQQALSLEMDGETFYFCSEECCRKFRSEKGEDL